MTKHRWLLLGLGLSIAFNLAFLGAFGYRQWTKHRHKAAWMERAGRFEGPPPFPGASPFPDEPVQFRTEQRKHFEHMRGMFLPAVKETRERLFEKRRQLADLVTADKPDTVAIGRALDEIGTLQIRIEKEVVRQMLKERDVMDPKQREWFRKIILKRLDDKGQSRHLRRSEDTEPKTEDPKNEGSPLGGIP
jgi:uncharacterized membrane protein